MSRSTTCFPALIFGDWSKLGSTDHELTGHGLSSFVALLDGTTAIIAEPLQNVKGAAIIRQPEPEESTHERCRACSPRAGRVDR